MPREKKTNSSVIEEGEDNPRNSKRTRVSHQHQQEIQQSLTNWEEEQKHILCEVEDLEIKIDECEELQRRQQPQTFHNLYMGGSNGIFTIVAVDSAGSYNIFMNAINRSINGGGGGGGGGTDLSPSSSRRQTTNSTVENRNTSNNSNSNNNNNNNPRPYH